MHTIGAVGATFGLSIDDHPVGLTDLLPGFDRHDALGLVVRSPLGGLGASGLIFAVVLDFYRSHEAEVCSLAPGELLYPDHHVIHVGPTLDDYSWLDFWPPHKEVTVPPAPAVIAEVLVGRGITRLLIEDGPPLADGRQPPPETRQRLADRLASCVAFSPTGRTNGADVRVVSNTTVERWVEQTIDESDRVPPEQRDAARAVRRAITDEQGAPVETYRRLTVADALAMLGC